MNKVQGGTPKSAPSLCQSCQYSMHVRGFNMREAVHCTFVGRMIHFPVYQCSKYVHGGQADLVEMKKIAWVIESRNRGPWGFKGSEKTEIVVRPPGTMPDVPDVIQEGQP